MVTSVLSGAALGRRKKSRCLGLEQREIRGAYFIRCVRWVEGEGHGETGVVTFGSSFGHECISGYLFLNTWLALR